MTKNVETTSVEIGSIFQALGNTFLEEVSLNQRQKQAFRNIVECQTLAKGGHVWQCQDCKTEVPMYNSCLDRHCPKCQGPARRKWVDQRMKELINTHYFHVVFTLPHCLNPLIAFNPKLLQLLFQAVSQTLLLFGKDDTYLGGEMGFLTVLHTWDQKLNRHYHLHCIIPGGALSADGKKWISSKRPDFLFPVHALSKTFRRLFWHGSKLLKSEDRASSRFPLKRRIVGLADRLKKNELTLPSNINLSLSEQLQSLENQLYRQRWVVYAKRPFGGPAQVLKYLGGYTHRVAISNYRILSHKQGMVTFAWKDRKKGNQTRTLTLPERKFAVQFLQHVLPSGFKKMRSYGFLSGTKKKKSLILCQKFLGKTAIAKPDDVLDSSGDDSEEPSELPYKRRCPKCHKRELIQVSEYSKQEVSNYKISIWNTG